MRLALFLLSSVLFLSGCEHYSNLTVSDFHRGGSTNLQFKRDNYECQIAAVVHQNMTGGGDVHGVYNDTYAGCMSTRGYRTSNIELLGIAE